MKISKANTKHQVLPSFLFIISIVLITATLGYCWGQNENSIIKIKHYFNMWCHVCSVFQSNGWKQSHLLQALVHFSSVAQSCSTLCDPMDCSMPGFPAHHQLPELTQTHVHRGSDAIQPSHPLLSPSLPAPNPSQHQGLFQ